MATITLDCELVRGNTGQNRCSVSPKPFVYHLLVPSDAVITAANLAVFQTYLQARLIDDNPLTRWHLIGRMVGIENGTTERANYDFQDGSSITTRNAIYRWTYDHQNGFCWHKNMVAFDGTQTQYRAIQIDTQNVMWASQYTDATGLPSIAPFEMSNYEVIDMEMANFDTPTLYKIMMEVSDTSQLNLYGQQAKLGFNVSTLKGVQGVQLSALPGNNWTTGVLNVAIAAACGGLNFTSEFGTLMADPDAWIATNGATGAIIPITAVTALANGTGFALDLDQSSGNYPTSGGSVDITTASVSDLAALGISYYEPNAELNIPRP